MAHVWPLNGLVVVGNGPQAWQQDCHLGRKADFIRKSISFFDHPHEKIITSKYYLLITLTTKIILQVAQKIDVKTKFIKDIFYDAKGKEIMCKLLLYFRQDTLLTEFIQDVKETSSEGSKSEKSPEDYILSELKKYVKKHQDFFREIE